MKQQVNISTTLMSAGGGTSEHFAPLFEQAGAIVIDNSSQWRMTEDVDLVVPRSE